jgi:hypothetical protein
MHEGNGLMLSTSRSRTAARLVVTLASAGGLVLAGSAGTAAASSGAVVSPNVTSSCCRLFENQDTHLRLDDSFEYGLRAYPYNGSNFQRWNVTHWNDNTWEMKNLATGRCIDDSFEYGLRAFPCNSSQYQSWKWHTWNDGTTEIRNQKTDRCLDNYYELRAVQCDTSTSQSWW